MIDQDAILTKKRFTKMIEECVNIKKMSYMDAILFICEKRHLDPADIKKFVTPPIKEKLEAEAISLRLIQNDGSKLPV